ncbi:uncharacterized protein [Blastocystis hominis]|uniref:NTF2 domain-containing protein n=1 Tax=Blastocystis hominis TaxID=12968 RepID=D8LYY1_BLAHO|nr:uncharacterized protein [Blastocystis hominis]CBK21020.2 unnamed protein product [Blastocystis hominis]|eukprot:XP_012895068.1 uncharacterized protein [Blastocystis hominis]
MLTFEGNEFLGTASIMGKITSIGATFAHDIKSTNVQPTSDGSVLICCTGMIRIDDNQPMMFAETFIIRDSGNNQYYVHNDIFRLILEYHCLFQQLFEYTR